MEYKRNCPNCGKELIYTDAGNFSRAKKNESVCRNCKKMSKEFKTKLSEYWTGRKREKYKRTPKEQQIKNYKRNCPDCGAELFYTEKYNYNQATVKNSKCNHCAKLQKVEIQ